MVFGLMILKKKFKCITKNKWKRISYKINSWETSLLSRSQTHGYAVDYIWVAFESFKSQFSFENF
jgi:hypothetical protein